MNEKINQNLSEERLFVSLYNFESFTQGYFVPSSVVVEQTLFFIWGFSSHAINFHRKPGEDCKFWPILGTHGHWSVRVFSVPHIQWHGAPVYNGHLCGPVSLTVVAQRFTVDLSPPVLTTKYSRSLDSYTQPSACKANALSDCAFAAPLHLNNREILLPKNILCQV